MKLESIVTATDFSEASVPALQAAFNLFLESHATLYVVHVLDLPAGIDPMGAIPPPSTQELREGALQQLDEMVPDKEGVNIEKVILEGSPARSIAEFAAEKKADMIIVGTHGRAGLERLLVGSTAEALLRRAPCQVLVVKDTSKQAEE